jgi:hypothetical protein
MFGKASVNLRISALLFAALLAGCGFTDATNRTGSDFLAAQGVSISSRDSLGTQLPVVGVQVIPVEGIPAPNGVEALWLGGTLGDSIRAVVAFDLKYASGPDAPFQAIRAVDSLAKRYPLTHLSFGIGSGGNADTVTSHPVRVRFLFLDSVTQTKDLPGLFMGQEPSVVDPSLQVVLDRDSQFVPSIYKGIPLGPQLRDSIAARLKAGSRSWLVAILDGHPGWESVFSLAGPVLRTDSINTSGTAVGTFLPGQFQARGAWRSTQMRSASAPSRSLGWWVGGGNRLRVTLDGDALRTLLHQKFGTGIVTPNFDNSFNILQARVRAPFSSFKYLAGSINQRGVGFAGAVVLKKDSSNFDTSASMPIKLGSSILTQLGLTVNPYLKFHDTLPGVLEGSYYQENTLASVPTRLSLGEGSSTTYTATNFWLRKDVPDSLEFRIASVVRVRVSHYPGAAEIHIHWCFLQNSPIADLQTGASGVNRPQSWVSDTAFATTTSPVVEQEIRTAVSLAVNQKNFSVDLDLVPSGGLIGMQDLWEARPSAGNVFDSLGMIVRPRDGGAF